MVRALLFSFIAYVSSVQLTVAQSTFAQEFTASATEGCAPLHVKFSTGALGTYTWDFGKSNNNTSNLMEPQVTYDEPGTYTVSLSVDGGQPIVKVAYIKVYAPPSPDFDFQYNPGCPPVQVQFVNNSTSVPEVPITSYQWIFGDGSSYSANSVGGVGHTYNLPGDKTITLLAKNENLVGCISTRVKTGLKVYDIQAKFSAPTFFCSAPATAQFTNNSIGPGQLVYSWSVDDTPISTQLSPSYTFTSLGTHHVNLTVNGDFNCTASSSQVIIVGTTSFEITADKTLICEGGEVNLSVNQGSYLNSWTWDFGNDSIPRQTLEQKVKYKNPGDYTVTLKAPVNNCAVTLKKKITVVPLPVPAFTHVPKCGRVLEFTNKSLYSASWLWDFGDGTTSNAKNPQHTYPAVGTYTVKLRAISVAGCSVDMDPRQVNIDNDPVAAFTPAQDFDCYDSLGGHSLSGCAPLEINFANSSSGIPISTAAWDFGDGRMSKSFFSKIVYSVPGTYTVKLTVAANGGCSSSTSAIVRVFDPAKVKAPNLLADNLNVCVRQDVHVQASPPSDYPLCWELEPGIFVTGSDFKYNFGEAGIHTIKVKIPGCSIEKTFPNAVTVKDPRVDFSVARHCRDPNDPSIPTPYQVDFVNLSTVKDSLIYSWDFGDGTTSTDRDPPRHEYPITPGKSNTYPVILNVKDPATQCVVTKQGSVTIQEVMADFTVRSIPADNADPAKAIKACKNDDIIFTDNSLLATSWSWQFGDPNGSKFENYSDKQNPTKSYKNAGNYTVTLTVYDGICASSKAMATPISISAIDGNFSVSATSDCSKLEAQFTDKSVATPPVTSWTWDFGNGDISHEQNPSYVYVKKGSYPIALTLVNADGECTIPSKDGITFTNPIADFSVASPFACIGQNVNVLLLAQYTNFVHWDFGNGVTSDSFTPAISYATTGAYPVTLYAKDFYGCEIEFSKPNFITITKPIAEFEFDKTIKECPPLVTAFSDKSTNAEKWLWSFGDGQSADSQNPVNTYRYPGTYSVSLNVIDAHGCTDSKTIPDLIKVDGPTGTFKNLNTLQCTNDPIKFSSAYVDAVNVQWDFGDGVIEENMNHEVSHLYKIAGKVQPLVILTDSKGCEVIFKTDMEMLVYQSPKADIKFSPAFPFEGESVTFSPDTTGLQFSWTFEDGTIQDSDTVTQIFNDSGIKNVVLSFTDQSTGCTTSIASEIQVQGYPDLIPNVFTPNNDQWNKTFEVLGIEKGSWELIVFNRWGSQVYKDENYRNQWNGGDLSGGTYYFELQNKVRQDKRITGPLTIIR